MLPSQKKTAATVLVADFSVVNTSSSLLDTAARAGTSELLFKAAGSLGLHPQWIVQDGLFAIIANNTERYVNFARSPLNSGVSTSLVGSKYLTRRILERHGIANIPYMIAASLDEARQFLARHGKIIAKPIYGSGAQDIHIVTSPEALNELHIPSYIFEKYIPGREFRYLVLKDEVIAVHESEYGDSVAADRPLRRISYPKDMWNPQLEALSLRITELFGLGFSAVDYMVDDTGTAHILEINTMPGLKWFHAPTAGPVVDVADAFMRAFVEVYEQHPDFVRR